MLLYLRILKFKFQGFWAFVFFDSWRELSLPYCQRLVSLDTRYNGSNFTLINHIVTFWLFLPILWWKLNFSSKTNINISLFHHLSKLIYSIFFFIKIFHLINLYHDTQFKIPYHICQDDPLDNGVLHLHFFDLIFFFFEFSFIWLWFNINFLY